MPLSAFSKQTQTWFEAAFEEPTSAQQQAWPAISNGDNVLLAAPTGSGKTLAAFLWAIDRLAREPRPDGVGTRLIYISPLKALSYDIERNLRAPLRGIGADITVAVRTGDTPQRERQAMLRNPPDILITTPESLYLMLTSQARQILTDCEFVIIDEIHAVAATKRGAHLALTLERLESCVDKPLQRIGLSATQRPLDEVGRFLVGPERECTVIDAGIRKPLDLMIHVPVESMVEPENARQATSVDSDPNGGPIPADTLLEELQGGEATRRSIWPAIYPEIYKLVREHRSTIVFVNNRRAAERIALRLNEIADREAAAQRGEDHDPSSAPAVEIARAHHGSLAREERTVVEDLLKSGQLPCLVATSSLELGIDMGAVDLVVQIESPKSVSRGLQRIGRAGHGVGETSKGRIFPKFRADLLECAVVTKRMREGEIEPTVVLQNPLDVLAQQIVAIVGSEESITVDQVLGLARRTYNFHELSPDVMNSVLDMLDGRYPSDQFAELRPRIVWDRIEGTLRPRKGAQRLAIVNAGTIPDRGLFAVVMPDGRRVGELDEEMVHEARAGQTFLLGASTWRIEEIGRDRVVVSPAPGATGAVPFWRGDSVGRPKELGAAIGEFARTAVDTPPAELVESHDLDLLAAENLVDFLQEQREATGVLPSDRSFVVERFRDEIGDWRLCLLSPYGSRIHAAWALALSARIRDELGLESDAIYSDDGIIVHLPDADEPPSADLLLFDPDEIEDLVVGELGGSALFGSRFRENAGRALLIPRNWPGRRTPLWQQRLKAQSLLEVAKNFSQFPIVLETYRECLQDVLDMPGLREIQTKLATRELGLVEVETKTASPFASSLLFDYVATYMYEGDAPNAERRAAALSLDRDLLRELLGQDELRELIDPQAIERLERELQRLEDTLKAVDADTLHDLLRRLGDLTEAETQARVVEGVKAAGLLKQLESDRRAVQMRIGGEQRWIASQDAGLYRDALGAMPPGGLPEEFIAEVTDPQRRLAARYARTHTPFTSDQLKQRYGFDLTSALRELEHSGELIRGELTPSGSEREWCDPDVLRRLRRATLALLRSEIEPAEPAQLARFLPAWHGIDSRSGKGAGVERLRDVLVPLQGIPLPAAIWEQDVLPRRLGAYSAAWLDQLCASGEVVWVGSGSSGRGSPKVALYFRDDAPLLGPPNSKDRQPGEAEHEAVRDLLGQGACFFTDLIAQLDWSPLELQQALWDLVAWGEATNDAFVPLRAPRLSLATATGPNRRGRRFGPRRGGPSAQVQGRWSLAAKLFEPAPEGREQRRALAEMLLERNGILTREHVLAERIAGGFSSVYDSLGQLETLGAARRGYFIEGLGGAQFALPGAVERLRSIRETRDPQIDLLAAADPAQAYGASIPWPAPFALQESDRRRRPSRVAGAYVVNVDGQPVIYVERGGRGLLTFVPPESELLRPALSKLADYVREGKVPKLALERIDGEAASGAQLESVLVELGFRPGPRKLTLSA